MSPGLLYATCGLTLFVLGLYALLAHAHLLRKILAFNVMGSGTFLALVGLGQRAPQAGPDPVPQAMVLTGIVVAASATAFALILARRYYAATGRLDLAPEEEEGKT